MKDLGRAGESTDEGTADIFEDEDTEDAIPGGPGVIGVLGIPGVT